MDISLAWLNRYLDPAGISADEADELLTRAGFPIEGVTSVTDGPGAGDTVLDVEVTSNRPDCLNHLGCAREVAAISSNGRGHGFRARSLVYPEFADPAASGDLASVLTLENTDHAACPLFTARVVRGCKIGPSPEWLRAVLEAVGQRAINNAVDVTNFITLELGNPCHVFDLKKLAGGTLNIRWAADKEPLRTLDGKERVLSAQDLVVADAKRAQSLAGVIGGGDSEVDDSTVDIVFEMATWDPVTVRSQARRHNAVTDAGYRFQRGVDPRTIDFAARRAVALLCELTGGTLCEGVLVEGAAMPTPEPVVIRPSRAKHVMGIDVPVGEQISLLRRLEIGVDQRSGDELACEIPPFRSRDLTREIDLIEEVARVVGLDEIPIEDRLHVQVRPPQPERRALDEITRVLTGLGFDETVTFSFTSPPRGALFLPSGLELSAVDDDRRKEEPTLRTSPLAGLLGCRRANQDARSAEPGTIRLFEIASAFAESGGRSIERQNLSLLLDVPGAGGKGGGDVAAGLRAMRGVIEQVATAALGPDAEVAVEPLGDSSPVPAFDPAFSGGVTARAPGEGEPMRLGILGVPTAETLKAFGVETNVVMAELGVAELVSRFPPEPSAEALPTFPGIERDVSLVLDESVRWSAVGALIESLGLDRLVGVAFVGAFRGKQVGAGKKSVTARLAFRDPDRTMRHEEVDPQIQSVIEAAGRELGATVRG